MRAIALHRLEPIFSVAAERMEDAGRVIAQIADGAHFGKLCLIF